MEQDRSFKRGDWYVGIAPLKDAQQMVRDHHYSKGGSNTAVYVHGLFRKSDDKLCGICWWLPPTRVACESVNKKEWKKVLSLTRLVILPAVPHNAATFLMSGSIRLIRADKRFVSLVTYACESQGHKGTIYRAGNWTYVGETGPYRRWVDANGRQVSAKATKTRNKAQMVALGYALGPKYKKHKFIMHLKGST